MASGLALLVRVLLRFSLIFAFIALWQGLSASGLFNSTIVPPPTEVAWRTVTLFRDATLRSSVLVTLQEIGIAFGISLTLGIATGAAMAASRRFASLMQPIIAVLLAAPMISFIPFLVLITGISKTTVIEIGSMASIALVIVNTRTGVETIDPLLKVVTRTFGHGRLSTFWNLTLPGALPYIVAGARLAAGRAILGVVVGEFFAGTDGLAYRAAEFQNFLETASLYAAVVWLVVIGIVINLGALMLEKRLSTWRAV